MSSAGTSRTEAERSLDMGGPGVGNDKPAIMHRACDRGWAGFCRLRQV
ncbi:hypothetical protein AZ78_4770 [Lysobacter capsici AZ78]|uniref:Uncharacterized protein n=1 Tax=Lysobacter capsici AZ78 TaxID=1444315 RepID=A0A108UDF4_9GAMM|nr:hypothetical protein AZ78_4770 [Lysobacter capsici AZ78]